MERRFYLELAARRLCMPIGTDLILHDQAAPDDVLVDEEKLGKVVQLAARRYATPLAFPLMDLRVEKADVLEFCRIPECAADAYHFDEAPAKEMIVAYRAAADRPFGARMAANLGALR